jgi:hypothetical protein
MNVKAKDENQPIKYLLGEMTEAEQARFEESFFQDAELSELVSDVENDLIDEYVREELSPSARERFERHFLVSERRRETVELARALLQAENAAAASKVVDSREQLPWWKAIFAAPRVPRTALSYSLGAAALVFLLAGLWLFSEVGQLRNEVSRLEADRETRDRQNDQLREQASEQHRQSDELSAQKEELEQRLTELRQQGGIPERETHSAPALLTFILSPGTRGGDEPKKLSIPPGAPTIRLQLNISPGDEYPAYQVKLQTATGGQVRTWKGLRAASAKGVRAVFVDVPANLLSASEYEVTLSGVAKGQSETLAYYYFSLPRN